MGVRAVEANAPLSVEFRAAMQPVSGTAETWGQSDQYPFTTNAMAAGIVPSPATITGRGPSLAVDPAQNNAFRLVNRALKAGASIRFTPASATRAASYVITGGNAAQIDAAANELWVSGTRLTLPRSSTSPAVSPRSALYKAAAGNMDEGWTEWMLDGFDFAYTLLGPADVQAGNLGSRFDAIVVASQGIVGGRGGRGGAGGGRGGRGGGAPVAGADDSLRVHAIDEFVRGGGTVVAWNQGTGSLIAALDLPVRNTLAGVPRSEYFTGISIMRALVDTLHPVMAGMPHEADVVVNGSPAFETGDAFQGAVLATYPTSGPILRSGFLKGEALMRGKAAALDVKHGNGHVVLIAFQPQWRGQPQGTFRVVFNSLFYSRAVSGSSP